MSAAPTKMDNCRSSVSSQFQRLLEEYAGHKPKKRAMASTISDSELSQGEHPGLETLQNANA